MISCSCILTVTSELRGIIPLSVAVMLNDKSEPILSRSSIATVLIWPLSDMLNMLLPEVDENVIFEFIPESASLATTFPTIVLDDSSSLIVNGPNIVKIGVLSLSSNTLILRIDVSEN